MVVSIALLVIAAYQWWRGAAPWVLITLVSIAAVLLLLAAVAPALLRPVYRGWMRVGEALVAPGLAPERHQRSDRGVGEALGWINTRILLTLVFFLVVTPIGLLMRLFGRSPIAVRRKDSYWVDVEPHSYGDRHVEKQF